MTDSLRLSLKPKGTSSDDSISLFIQQISNQRGAFRNVSEQDLIQEIANGSGNLENIEDKSVEGVDKPEVDDIQVKRHEILLQAQ